MTRELLKDLLDVVEAAIQAGDWKVDGACDPDLVIRQAKEALAQTEQDPVAYAGVKVWVGNQQVVRCLTQTELHYAVEPWLLVELNALKCIASFKEKKT